MDRAPQVVPPQGELLVDPAGVAGGRLEAPDGPRERAAVVLQADRGVAQQQLEVVARVGVERGEDLVEVDVRQRLRGRDPLALGELARLRGAGIELGDHVLEPRLGAHENAGVPVDRRVLALDVQSDHGPAALELHARDLADLDARDVDRLALPRGDRLGRRELGLDGDEVAPEDRHAGRQRQPLLVQDEHRHHERDDEQGDDRREVAPVLADGGHLAPSFVGPKGRSLARRSGSAFLAASAAWPVGADLAAAGPLRFGGVCR